ncbi:MAG TPA: hypothetical protein VI197_04940 [Polyangiaceae bacterium]
MKKWLALCVLGLTGCGAELERSSEVETLRVLGVHKSQSYAKAGEQVTFSMLWHDPEGREITPVWFAATEAEMDLVSRALELDCDPTADPADPDCECLSDPEACPESEGARPWDPSDALLPLCANPPRDTYYECLQLHNVLADPTLRALASKPGESITLNVPTSTVVPPSEQLPSDFGLPSLKPCKDVSDSFECRGAYHEPPDRNLPDFGSMFVFFALCPGELDFENVREGFGLVCNDETGEAFGPDDFQFGYSQIFLYDEIENHNPVVEGIALDGVEVPAACIGPACLEGEDELPVGCDGDIPCFKVCTESNEDDCPEIDVKPIIFERVPCSDSDDGPGCDDAERNNAERDEVAKIAYGRNSEEQMWIRYYANQGRMASEVRLLNDATTGWNSDYGTELRLPQEPGPLRVWAVVYDNRGGQDWVRVDAYVEE